MNNSLYWSVTQQEMQMKTSEHVRTLALYGSQCCAEEVLFDRGDSFSRCPRCEALCSWQFVEKVFSWKELESVEALAA
jgi:hypothetical protein